VRIGERAHGTRREIVARRCTSGRGDPYIEDARRRDANAIAQVDRREDGCEIVINIRASYELFDG
jgi:hypothetical protein